MYNGSDRLLTTANGTCTVGVHFATTCVESPTITATTRMYTPELRNPAADPYLDLLSGCHDSGYGGIHVKNCNGQGKGYLYWAGTNYFGLLHCAGGWALKLNGDTSVYLYYNNALKLQTTAAGVTVTGGLCGTTAVCSPIICGSSWVCSGGTICGATLCAGVVCATSCLQSPILRATNTATIGSTTAPPETFMVCGNSRFVRGGNPVTIYMGSNYQSVDVGFVWAACQDLQIKTYSGGWNQALRVLGINTYACGCLQSPTLCATTLVKGNKLCATTTAGIGTAAHATYPLMVGGNTRYQFAICNSGASNAYYPWLVHDTDNLIVHFNGIGDKFSFHNSGVFCAYGCAKSPIVCGTSCVISGNSWLQSTCIKGPIVCATACVKSPTLCATTKVNYGACATSYICSNGDYLKHENQYGYINIGPGNSSWAHISTDRNSFYFNTKLTVNSGCVASYDEDMQLVRIGSATQRLVVGPGTTTSCQQMCICGNLYVSGMVCTEGVEGDTFNSASCKLNSITCFNTSCVTGYDAIYDIYVSANPNCAGSGVYRDVVHMTSYVTTGYSGSAVTKYINTVEHFSRGDAHSSGAGSVTASVHLLVGTVGCECYAQGCNTCLQVRICGGSTATNAAARGSECVLIKRIL
tara:strand:- start:1154 stop:3067 length:1914 start_codon:yes stop_codon:yes gene_type:complete